MNRNVVVPFVVLAIPFLGSMAYIFRDSLPQTEASRTQEIAKNIFDNCVKEMPKYMKLPIYKINEACAINANDEAKKQYAIEKLTGKKGLL